MIRSCEKCWEQFDNQREDAGIHFCPKCLRKLKNEEIEHG